MASLRGVFNKTPGAWTAGKPYPDSGDLYLKGGRWTNPDSILPLTEGQAVFCARLGPGQVLALGIGGVYAASPPGEEEPEEP